jgi:DNA-binding phage protein
MTKKRTLKKQKFCLEDTPIIQSKKQTRALQHKPSEFFQSHEKVAAALLQSLEENDAGAFLEILDIYLRVNRTKVAKATKMSRTTVQNALY